MDAAAMAAQMGDAASRRGGLLGWGVDPGAVTLDGSAGSAFRRAPAVPAGADPGIVALLRAEVDAEAAGGSAAEWRSSLERAGVAWAAALPGGPELCRADVSHGVQGAAAGPAAGRHASDAHPALVSTGASVPASAPASARSLLAAAASCASGTAAVSPDYGSCADDAEAEALALAALGEVLRRVGAGGLESAERRSAETYGDDVFARALPTLVRLVAAGRGPASRPVPHRLHADSLTLSGLLPASAASPDEVVEVLTEGRVGTAAELAELLGLAREGVRDGSAFEAIRRRGEAAAEAAAVLASGLGGAASLGAEDAARALVLVREAAAAAAADDGADATGALWEGIRRCAEVQLGYGNTEAVSSLEELVALAAQAEARA